MGSRKARTEPSGPAAGQGVQHVPEQTGVLREDGVVPARSAKSSGAGAARIRLPSVAGPEALAALRRSAASWGDPEILARLRAAEESRRLFEEALGSYRRLHSEVARRHDALAAESAAMELRSQALELREASIREREEAAQRAEAGLDSRARLSIAGGHALQVTDVSSGINRVGPAFLEPAAPGPDRPSGPFANVGGTIPDVARPYEDRGGQPGPTLAVVSPSDLPPTRAALGVAGRKNPDRVPSGTPRLDDLLYGGLPTRSHVVLVGDTFVGKEVTLYAFLAEGLRRNEPAILVTAARAAHDVSKGLRHVLPDLEAYQKSGWVTWIDASGAGRLEPPQWLAPRDSDDTTGLLSALSEATQRAKAATLDGRFRVGFLGLSAVLAHRTEREAFLFLQSVVGVLRPCEALAMYALEAGALSEPQVETLLGRMDGAVLFRQNRGQTLISVKGFGEVATRDWIECRATDQALVLGSFGLERIR